MPSTEGRGFAKVEEYVVLQQQRTVIVVKIIDIESRLLHILFFGHVIFQIL